MAIGECTHDYLLFPTLDLKQKRLYDKQLLEVN